MDRQCRLSHVAKTYLDTFECILSEMIQEMTEVELTDSISDNFIIQMIPHHRAAVTGDCPQNYIGADKKY